MPPVAIYASRILTPLEELNDAVILGGQLKLTDGDPVRVEAAP